MRRSSQVTERYQPEFSKENVRVDTITNGNDRLALDERVVGEIAKSVIDVGLLSPIIVLRLGPMAHKLIAGAHRLEAFRLLNLDEIPCQVVKRNDAVSRAWAVLAEIDETLSATN